MDTAGLKKSLTLPYLLLSLSVLLTKALSSTLEAWMDSFSLASSLSSLLRSRVSFRCRSRSWATSWSSLWAWISSRRALTRPSSASCSCWRRLSNFIHRFDKIRKTDMNILGYMMCIYVQAMKFRLPEVLMIAKRAKGKNKHLEQ